LASLGLPQSFLRYVPELDHRGAVRAFDQTSLLVALCGGFIAALPMLWDAPRFAVLLFSESGRTGRVVALAIGTPLLIALRCVTGLAGGLKEFRAQAIGESLYTLGGLVLA